MPERKEEVTERESVTSESSTGVLSRRRMLQVTGTGVVGGMIATSTISAESDEYPNTIIFENQGSTDASYEFLVSGSLRPAEEVGVDDDATISASHVTGTLGTEQIGYQFSGPLNYLDVDGNIDVSIQYGDEGDPAADRIEIVAADDGDIEYTFEVTDRATKVLENGEYSADEDDEVTRHENGSSTVTGSTAEGAGDTYDFQGEIEHFEPVEGEFTLFINGEQTTVPELTGQEPPADEDTEHELRIETIEETPAMHYRIVSAGEIERGEWLLDHDEVFEEDGKWVAEGQIGPTGTDNYHIVGDKLEYFGAWHIDTDQDPWEYTDDAVPAEQFDLRWDGEAVHPEDIAAETYDEGQEKEETLEEAVFRAGYHEGEWLNYRLHIDTEPTALTDDEDEYFAAGNFDTEQLSDGSWLIEGRTGTADPSGPMYGDGYRFEPESGNGILGWEADREEYFVSINDEETDPETLPELDLPEEETESGDGGDVIGGGAGYDRTIPESDADYTAASASELQSALSSAGSGDVVYITADFNAGSGSFTVRSDVTVAGDRGIDGAAGPLVTIDAEPNGVFELRNGARLTGIRLRGPYHGVRGTSHSQLENQAASGVHIPGDNAEIDNTEISGFGLAGVWIRNGSGNNHIHHNYIYDNNTNGLGYGVVVYGSSSNPLVEYNYFNDNRHSIASSGDNYGYICRFNHFGPRSFHVVIDIHDPGATETYVQNNIVESIRRDLDDQRTVAVGGHSQPPADILVIEDNWFYQERDHAFSVASSNVEIQNNHYTPDADVEYGDIIPDHPGADHTPW